MARSKDDDPAALRQLIARTERARAAAAGSGMNTVVSNDRRGARVRVTQDEIIAELVDGRVISVSLAWS